MFGHWLLKNRGQNFKRFDANRNGDLTHDELVEAILTFTDSKEHLEASRHEGESAVEKNTASLAGVLQTVLAAGIKQEATVQDQFEAEYRAVWESRGKVYA